MLRGYEVCTGHTRYTQRVKGMTEKTRKPTREIEFLTRYHGTTEYLVLGLGKRVCRLAMMSTTIGQLETKREL